MSIEKLIGDLIVALNNNTAALQAAGQAAPEAKSAPKSSTKTTEPASSAPAAEPAPQAEAPEPVSSAAAPAASEVTLADITTVVLDLGKAGKRAALVSLLAEYGVPKASALDPSKFAEFHTKASALLGGAA